VSYPAAGDAFDDAEIRDALQAVRLDGLVDRLDERQNWAMQLSGGEQQRLAVARALLQHPDWLFLDEATSALDSQTEAHVYDLMRERLADTTVVSIAHRPPADDFQDATIELVPTAEGTRLLQARYTGELAAAS